MTPSNSKPIALITGAASGLGLALAHQLHSEYQLVLVDINAPALEQQFGGWADVDTHTLDLTNSAAVATWLDQIAPQLPRLDLLINNAGITHRSLATVTQLDVIERVLAVDYLAPVQLTQGLLPLLQKSRGKIVNMGSMAGWMPVLGRAGYCAAKSALTQYFETLRAELTDTPVSILMVYPSFVDTPIENHALDGQGLVAKHPRSMVGKMRSTKWMAERIVRAIQNNRLRLFPDRFTYFASLLYRIAPSFYLRLMRRRLRVELDNKR